MHARWAVGLVASLIAVAPAAAAPKDKRLPGFTGLVYRDVAMPHACVKHARVVRQSRKGDDAALVALLTWPRITGLDFPPDDDARRSASMQRFEAWVKALMDQAQKTRDRQLAVARDPARTPVQRVEAVARMVVAQAQVVELFQSIDVPPSIRAMPDAQDAFCDALADKAAPLAGEVTQVRGYCAKVIRDGKIGPGWWTAVCALPDEPEGDRGVQGGEVRGVEGGVEGGVIGGVDTAPPPPPPPPPPPARPMNIAPTAFEAQRIAGDKAIPPDDATRAAIAADGTRRVQVVVKLCIDDAGAVAVVTVLKSSGYPAYDAAIRSTIRATWRFRPFMVNGASAAVCSAVTFIYTQV